MARNPLWKVEHLHQGFHFLIYADLLRPDTHTWVDTVAWSQHGIDKVSSILGGVGIERRRMRNPICGQFVFKLWTVISNDSPIAVYLRKLRFPIPQRM